MTIIIQYIFQCFIFIVPTAEMWFGIVFAIMVEIVPLSLRSTTVGVFLFVMNNIGGNLPILVDPVSKSIGYRESISLFYAGFYGISKCYKICLIISFCNPIFFSGSVLFLITMFFMEGPKPATKSNDVGHENAICTTADETGLPTLHQNGVQTKSTIESSHL